ncbi:MAG: hypothetical protein PHG97_05045 [Candidatus Margulisbacteria bacterium]|nr:hypothetical protein [Candidatus Margulisiibacteriota bacterium]
MKLAKICFAILLPVLLFSNSGFCADLNYPYGRINLRLPPAEDPFPGFGGGYSTISLGMKSALWNPATLGKLKLAEASFGQASVTGPQDLSRTTPLKEMSGTLEVGAGTGSSGNAVLRYALFFRPAADVAGIGTTTKEIQVKSSLSYATSGTGINFSAAQRVNDWLTVGFASRNPLQADISLAGNFPVTGRTDMSLYGQNFGSFSIKNDGKLSFTFTSGGVVTTRETAAPAWSGFLSQEVTIPFSNISEFRNSFNVESPYVGTIAAQRGNFYAGLNMLPISATAQIDNDVRTVVNADTADQVMYSPNFDPNDPVASANWFLDANQYGAQAGYSTKTIQLPSGDIIANAKYRGFYSGSTARFDFGLLYDPTEWFTVGLMLENVNSAALDMKGNGLAGYMTYRNINTQEATTLLQPGGNSTWAPFGNQWVTTTEANGTPIVLDAEKNYQLPKRLRCGFSLKRPFLIAVDYEQNQTPFTIPASNEITVSNLSFIRVGVESRLLSLPFWLRGGTTLALKPTITSKDQQLVDNINKAFKFGVVPVKLDLGSTLNLWGWEIWDSLGVSLMPLIGLVQFDAANIDLGKMVYLNLALKKDAWQVDYLSQVDPVATLAANRNSGRPARDGSIPWETSDLRFTQTLGVTYKF